MGGQRRTTRLRRVAQDITCDKLPHILTGAFHLNNRFEGGGEGSRTQKVLSDKSTMLAIGGSRGDLYRGAVIRLRLSGPKTVIALLVACGMINPGGFKFGKSFGNCLHEIFRPT